MPIGYTRLVGQRVGNTLITHPSVLLGHVLHYLSDANICFRTSPVPTSALTPASYPRYTVASIHGDQHPCTLAVTSRGRRRHSRSIAQEAQSASIAFALVSASPPDGIAGFSL